MEFLQNSEKHYVICSYFGKCLSTKWLLVLFVIQILRIEVTKNEFVLRNLGVQHVYYLQEKFAMNEYLW